MSLEVGTFLRAAVIPRGFYSLLSPNEVDPLTLRIARKQRMSRGALFILAAADSRPTPQESKGILYFAQLVKSADDVIDRRMNNFTDEDELRSHLLTAPILGTNATIQEALQVCLHCYPLNKQEAITSFVDQMVKVHVTNPQRGIPGQYSYEDAADYRRVTTEPLLVTLAEITSSNKDKFVAIGRVWQLIEDALDWTEDAQEESKNQFLGMAVDSWNELGQKPGMEIDHLLNTLDRWQRGRAFDFRLNALLGIKSPKLSLTREKYRKEILRQTPPLGTEGTHLVAAMTRAIL